LIDMVQRFPGLGWAGLGWAGLGKSGQVWFGDLFNFYI
jgi:hypothetical protein